MKKFWVIVVLIAGVAFAACQKKKEEASCNAPVNPNGDSELALLMREMTAHLESEHKLMLEGKAPGEMPEGYDKIKTAKPTDSKQLSGDFGGFADLYLEALKNYHNAKPENYRFAYNNLVKSCISCHENECPGPIKRIEKLILKEAAQQ